MAYLKVLLRGRLVKELTLREDQVYTGGRKEDCDILLQPEKGISREHFQISFKEGTWVLDALSRFGDVLIGGEKIQTSQLENGQTFMVSPYEFEFFSENLPKTKMESSSSAAISENFNSDSHQVGRSEASTFDDEKTFVGGTSLIPILKMSSPNKIETESVQLINARSFLAGRDPTCAIFIDDQRVSRRQFEMNGSGANMFITDLGSVNGTYLNGQVLQANEPVAIKSGDAISVLDHQMIFELHDPNFNNLLGQVKSLVAAEPHWPGPVPSNYLPPNAGEYRTYEPPPQRDVKKIAIRLVIGGLGLFLIFKAMGPVSEEKSQKVTQTDSRDPLAKLNDEQKMMVKHYYQLAENYLAQQKWMLAKGEIEKIKQLVPNYEKYERSKELESHADQGIQNEMEMEKIERQQQAQKELTEKVQRQLAYCQSKVNSRITKSEIEECLQPILQFDPENPKILKLRAQVDAIETDRLVKDQRVKDVDRQAGQLRQLFQRAESEERRGDLLVAIKSYETVARSSLPDRGGYKLKAERQVSTLRSQVNSKISSLISSADKSGQEQQFKTAILTLRKAKRIDPNNADIDEKIETFTRELKKAMQLLYQEGVLEEGFGNIEGGEGKPGAKDKWKKILEMDISDGEYYLKARQRLKKYGVL